MFTRRQDRDQWAVLRYGSVERWDARAGEPWGDPATADVLSAAPFQYLSWLRAHMRGGGEVILAAGDPGQGLCVGRDLSGRGSGVVEPSTDVSTFPVGEMERVQLHYADDGTCPMVVLTIDGREVVVVAGDVVEGDIIWNDEELLVFADVADVDRVAWRNPPDVVEVVEIESRASRRGWR